MSKYVPRKIKKDIILKYLTVKLSFPVYTNFNLYVTNEFANKTPLV